MSEATPPTNSPSAPPARGTSALRVIRQAASKARGFVMHAALASKMRVRRVQVQRKIDAAKFEMTERIFRDAGMHILANELVVPGEEALHQAIESKQAMCEMLDRAVASGDTKRKPELAMMSRELTDLQESLGERALDCGFEFPQREDFVQRRKDLSARLTSLEAERDAIVGQLAAESGRRKLSFRITFGAACLVLLIGLIFVGSALFKPSGYFKGVAAGDHLESGLGLVVCGFQIHEVSGEKKEIESVVGTGSSFAITHDGFLLTNKHVVEETHLLIRNPLDMKKLELENKVKAEPAVWVIVEGRKVPARIAYVSDQFDLAVLKVDLRFDHIFQLCASEQVPRGTEVWAAGFPAVAREALSAEEDQIRQVAEMDADTLEKLFQASDLEFVMTRGTVSRTVKSADDRWWIQHNADINPGNSGGPLVRDDGVVVGINTLGFTVLGASGTFYALELGQARSEIERVAREAVWQ